MTVVMVVAVAVAATVEDPVRQIAEMNVRETLPGLPPVVPGVAVSLPACPDVRQVAIHLRHRQEVPMVALLVRLNAIMGAHHVLAVVNPSVAGPVAAQHVSRDVSRLVITNAVWVVLKVRSEN